MKSIELREKRKRRREELEVVCCVILYVYTMEPLHVDKLIRTSTHLVIEKSWFISSILIVALEPVLIQVFPLREFHCILHDIVHVYCGV